MSIVALHCGFLPSFFRINVVIAAVAAVAFVVPAAAVIVAAFSAALFLVHVFGLFIKSLYDIGLLPALCKEKHCTGVYTDTIAQGFDALVPVLVLIGSPGQGISFVGRTYSCYSRTTLIFNREAQF